MDILLATQIICVLGDMTLQSRPSKRLHLEISDFDTVALKFGLDPFPTQFDPLNKNMKSDFRKTKRILRYMEITIIGVSEAHFRAFLGSFQYLPLGNIRPRMLKKRT